MNTKFSQYAKIIDPDSEYYGQVFEVGITNRYLNVIQTLEERRSDIKEFSFSQIQFCVTKDNKPVKIGEEYVCLKDEIYGEEIYDFVEMNGNIRLCTRETMVADKKDSLVAFDSVTSHSHHLPLHPTNKIKITAEGKEYWVSRETLKAITK